MPSERCKRSWATAEEGRLFDMTKLVKPVAECKQIPFDPYEEYGGSIEERPLDENPLDEERISDLIAANRDILSHWIRRDIKKSRSAIVNTTPAKRDPAIATPVAIGPPLLPNKADISAHLYALFDPAFVQAYQEAWIEIAYGNPATGGAVDEAQNISVFKLKEAVEFAEARNKAGWNLYVAPALRQGKQPSDGRANDGSVLTSDYAWVEFDGAGDDLRIEAILKANNLTPAIIVTTGLVPHRRAHLYFKLDGVVTPEQLKAANTSLCKLLGSDAVQNASRLMRLAGTINYPSPKKRERGYVEELTTLKNFPNAPAYKMDTLIGLTPQSAVAKVSENKVVSRSIDWAKVDEHAGWLKCVEDLPQDFNAKGKVIVAHTGNIKDLNFDLEYGGAVMKPYSSWSEVGHALAAMFKHDGRYTAEQIAAALMCDLPCNQHVTKQPNEAARRRAVERSILRSHEPAKPKLQRPEGEPDWRERKINGSPIPSMHNARLAITALGIECSRDTFHNKTLFGYRDDQVRHELQSIVGEVSDDGIIALRQLMSDRFGFDMEDKATRDAVKSLAREHCFDPVCDLIDKAEAEWDGIKRLDRMAADYFNCEDTPLNSAFMRKMMIALVKRAREPGCKFDTIVVLESKEGFNKSTAWRVLAGAENFSDERIIGSQAKEVQEQLAEIWIHENADLAGLKKTEVESVKAYASRMVDIARPAFGHFVLKQPRHSIEVGTTNSDEYLQSQTGNRRFWPLTVTKAIDIEKLQHDRLQLIGEAAKYQSDGESVVLDEVLWADAGIEQEQRRIKDPWEDVLGDLPEWISDGYGGSERLEIIHQDSPREVVSAAVLVEYVLKIPVAQQTTATAMRLSNVMKQLGWHRDKNGYVSIGGKRVKGYWRWQIGKDPKYQHFDPAVTRF
jgi:virulence-associated protein E